MRIRDKETDFRWNSKVLAKQPLYWSADNDSDHQILFQEIDGNNTRYADVFVFITMYHFLGRRMKLFESRPFNYGRLYSEITPHTHTYVPQIMSIPVGEFPKTVTLQFSPEDDISQIQRFAEHVKKLLHLS